MDILKKNDLKQLIEKTDEWCISLYMPTHRAGREQQQDPIRFKNLVVQAEEKLLKYDLRRPDVLKLLQPVENLVADNTDFWQHQSDGLAVFLSTDFSQIYRLPFRFDELLVISKNFHIKPLLPLFNENGQFYILALSQNHIRLFLGNRDFINEVELPDIPTSMQEALYMDDPEKHLDFHTGTRNPSAPGSQPAMFHGQGKPSDDDEKNILRYFQYVGQGLKRMLNDESIPMLLAGVDYLLPIFRKAYSYPGLLSDNLSGNPDEMDAKELHQRAWELIEPIFNENKLKAMKQFERLHGEQSDRAEDELKSVVKAAKYGQVDTLFVPLSIQRWGRYEPQGDRVELEEKHSLDNEDLLNFAAAQTILNAGQVYAIQPEEIPGGGDLAAILRY